MKSISDMAYKTLIFVSKKSQFNQALKLYNSLFSNGENALILTRYIFSDFFLKQRYPIKDFQFYEKYLQISFQVIAQEAYGLFNSLAEEKAHNNLTLRELTKYKDISLWDLSVEDISLRFQKILYEFNMLEAVLNFERPSKIIVISEDSDLKQLLISICKERQIHFSIYNNAGKKNQNISKVFKRMVFLLKKVKRFKKSLFYFGVNLIKAREGSQKYKVIFFSSVERYLGSILPVIYKYDINERLIINTFPCSSKRFKALRIPYMDFDGYKLYSIYDKYAQRLLKEIYNSVHSNDFLNKIMYKKVSIGGILNDMLEELIFETFYHNIQKVDIIREILRQHKPRAIVVIHYSVDIALTAKSMSTPVIAIQSCSIDEFCLFGPLIHDAVILDGNYWKEYLLKKQDINPEKIHVTGPVRFDDCPGLEDRLNIKDFCNLPSSKKIVVFAANYPYLNMTVMDHEKIKNLNAIYAAMKNIKEAHLVIKLHPYEKDLDLYKSIAKKVKLLGYSIVKDVEMLELTRHSDLLITQVSTAGYGAVLLDKNVISLCGTSNFEPEDIWDFRKYDAAIVLDNFEDLEKSIRKALFDPDTMYRLKEGRKKYIYEHAYKLDGNVSTRVKDVIDRFLLK